MLEKIKKELDLRENTKTKLFVPVTATLPNHLSNIFLQRIGAALTYTPIEYENDELRKQILLPIWAGTNTASLHKTNKHLKNLTLKANSLILAAAAAAAASANNRRFNPVVNFNNTLYN